MIKTQRNFTKQTTVRYHCSNLIYVMAGIKRQRLKEYLKKQEDKKNVEREAKKET